MVRWNIATFQLLVKHNRFVNNLSANSKVVKIIFIKAHFKMLSILKWAQRTLVFLLLWLINYILTQHLSLSNNDTLGCSKLITL